MKLRVTLDIEVPAANRESGEALLRYHLQQVLPNAEVVKVEEAKHADFIIGPFRVKQ